MAQANNNSLIEEALSDAEQVRETALANAKAQLEEAFTPRIKSMVSKQLQTELDEEKDDTYENPSDEEELGDPLEEEEDYEDEEDEMDDEDEEEMEEGMGDVEDEDEEGTLADPTNADDSSLEEEDEEDVDIDDIEDEEDERDLDLEAVISELEAELEEEEDYDEEEGEVPGEQDTGPDEYEDDEEEELDEDIIDLDELLQSLNEEEDEEDMDIEDEEDDEEEEIDLEELFNSLDENEGESDEELVETLAAENEKLTSENAEYREAVEILRSKLNEVNLLNAKLLYTSKLFRKYNLNNSQKMKVVESFDRTKSVRETKLVFSTLAESFTMNGGSKKSSKSKGKRNASLTEGLASKPVKSTKPKKGSDNEIINESKDITDRFKTLVNYNK